MSDVAEKVEVELKEEERAEVVELSHEDLRMIGGGMGIAALD